jgi:hypothetical protein
MSSTDLIESSENKPDKTLQVVTDFFEETQSLREMNLRIKQYLKLVS